MIEKTLDDSWWFRVGIKVTCLMYEHICTYVYLLWTLLCTSSLSFLHIGLITAPKTMKLFYNRQVRDLREKHFHPYKIACEIYGCIYTRKGIIISAWCEVSATLIKRIHNTQSRSEWEQMRLFGNKNSFHTDPAQEGNTDQGTKIREDFLPRRTQYRVCRKFYCGAVHYEFIEYTEHF